MHRLSHAVAQTTTKVLLPIQPPAAPQRLDEKGSHLAQVEMPFQVSPGIDVMADHLAGDIVKGNANAKPLAAGVRSYRPDTTFGVVRAFAWLDPMEPLTLRPIPRELTNFSLGK
jgi:hypothetical protein